MAQSNQPAAENCATVWFARLERAKNDHDFVKAAKAVCELRRLGVNVKFAPINGQTGGPVRD